MNRVAVRIAVTAVGAALVGGTLVAMPASAAPGDPDWTSGAVVGNAGCYANEITGADVGHTVIDLPFEVRMNRKLYDNVWVNPYGSLSFKQPAWAPQITDELAWAEEIISPFNAYTSSLDFSAGINSVTPVTYGFTTWNGHQALCVTWEGMAPTAYGEPYFDVSNPDTGYGFWLAPLYFDYAKRNTFQVLLVDRNDVVEGGVDIVMNYDTIQWQEFGGNWSANSNDPGYNDGYVTNFQGEAGYAGGIGLEPCLTYGCWAGYVDGSYLYDQYPLPRAPYYFFPQGDARDALLDTSPTGPAVTSTDSSQQGRHIYHVRQPVPESDYVEIVGRDLRTYIYDLDGQLLSILPAPPFPPGLGYDGEPVTDYDAWFSTWQYRELNWPVGAPEPIGTTYFAMGDSYQSGEGTYTYYGDSDTNLNQCHRSPKAYPQLLDDMNLFGDLDFEFWACSGATSTDAVLSGFPSSFGPPWNDPNRLSWKISSNVDRGIRPIERIDDDVVVITIGMGGNDVGFESILGTCVENSLGSTWDDFLVGPLIVDGFLRYSCEEGVGRQTELNILKLSRPIEGVDTPSNRLQFMIEALHREAPNAQIYVFGYPRFFPVNGRSPNGIYRGCFGIRPSDQVWMNSEIAFLNKIVKASAESRGAQYIDIYNAGNLQEICSTDRPSEWFMNGLDLGWESLDFDDKKADAESFHPNVKGHQLIATRFLVQAKAPPTGWYGSIQQGASASYAFVVGTTTVLSASVRYRGSDIPITLTSPSGEVFDRNSSQSNLVGEVGSNWEYLDITDPEPGEWLVELYGAEIDGIGEPFHFQWTEGVAPNAAPVAIATLTRSGSTVTVSGTSSYDTDGSIVEMAFDFGDGTVEFGESATHTYVEGGEVLVTMWVKDDMDAYGFATVGDVLTIDGPATPPGPAGPQTPHGTPRGGTGSVPSTVNPTPSASPSTAPSAQPTVTPEPTETATPTPTPSVTTGPDVTVGGPEDTPRGIAWVLWLVIGGIALIVAGVLGARRWGR